MQLFDRLRKEQPNFADKISVVNGELTEEHLGMKDEDFEPLKDKFDYKNAFICCPLLDVLFSFSIKLLYHAYISLGFPIIFTEYIWVPLTIPHFSIQIVIHSAATIKFTEKIQFVPTNLK